MAFLGQLPIGVAADQQASSRDLTEIGLERLLEIEVTSVSKREQRLFQTASAIYVITQEDIRRSGATSIPEVLRMVPGVHVARINSNMWAISARGFNGRFSDKMLVMMDGRTLYTPLFSGVYWDVQDTVLEDIERIEVIRGPGGTVWGANAVNGVINIITRHSRDTQGGLVAANFGGDERGLGTVRYGGKIGERGAYRAYGKYFNRADSHDASSRSLHDEWYMRQGGFRSDWSISRRDSLTVQGDIYNGVADQELTFVTLGPPYRAGRHEEPTFLSGGNLLARWTRVLSHGELSLQAYYDRTNREHESLAQTRNIFDLDLQHHVAIAGRHEVVWGVGYRISTADFLNSFEVSFGSLPTEDVASTFVQDEIALVRNRLFLTLGSKFEHNDYSGFEYQPSARMAWIPSRAYMLWGAASRAVRTPTPADRSMVINAGSEPVPGSLPTIVRILGDPSVGPERLVAYEIGQRWLATPRVSIDTAAFYHDYDELIGLNSGRPSVQPRPLPHLIIPLRFGNLLRGGVYGAEIAADWRVSERLNFAFGYSALRMELHRAAGVTPSVENVEGESPGQQFHARAHVRLTRSLELDTALFRISSLPALATPAHTRVDARLGWHPRERLELSLGFQNLPRHFEFASGGGFNAGQPRRGVLGKVTWLF